MLFIIYLISGVFFLVAARNPVAYVSFLNFTMWANLFHGLLMAVQTASPTSRLCLILAFGIYVWRPRASQESKIGTHR